MREGIAHFVGERKRQLRMRGSEVGMAALDIAARLADHLEVAGSLDGERDAVSSSIRA